MSADPQDPLLEAWTAVLRGSAERTALLHPGGQPLASFREVEERARYFERESELRELESGEVVAIQIGNHADWPALCLACLRRRLVVLPLERTISSHETETALKTSHAAACISALGSDSKIERRNSASPICWGGHPPSLLKLTSGTTAAPRVIRFRSAQLLADCDQICETMGIAANDLNFAIIPISHSYGFSNLLTPLIARGVALVLSRDRMPRAVLADLARTEATVFPGMPVFFQAFSEMEEIPPLPKLRLCISAGAPLRASVSREFRRKFNLPIHSFYGSSECGGICYDHEGTQDIEGYVGAPMHGVEVTFVELDSFPSRIRVRSAAAADGYFPEANPEKLSNGMFFPDDLIVPHAEGMRVVGRVSDIINVAGKKVNPAEVEAELLRFDGVEEAVVFGRESPLRNQEVIACVVAAEGITENALLDFCRARLSGWQVPKRLYLVPHLPVNERGKISRRDLAAHFPA